MLAISESAWETLMDLALRSKDLGKEITPVDNKNQVDASVFLLLP